MTVPNQGLWTPTLDWHSDNKRRYSLGVDRGVLDIDGVGVAWSGLVSVEIDPRGEGPSPHYLDGSVFRYSQQAYEYGARVEAYTYPEEFEKCLGIQTVAGVSAYGQMNAPFDMCYRTFEGNGRGYGEHYKLHFMWNCIVAPSTQTSETISDSAEAGTFSWDIYAIPIAHVGGLRPTTYFTISSRQLDPFIMDGIEQMLYGMNGSTPRIPSLNEISEYIIGG